MLEGSVMHMVVVAVVCLVLHMCIYEVLVCSFNVICFIWMLLLFQYSFRFIRICNLRCMLMSCMIYEYEYLR